MHNASIIVFMSVSAKSLLTENDPDRTKTSSSSKLSAQIHCQLSKCRNHIQNGEWHKVTCPEEHQTDGSNGMHFYPLERTYGQTMMMIVHIATVSYITALLSNRFSANLNVYTVGFLCLRQPRLAGDIMFSTCPSVRSSVRSLVRYQTCEHDVLKMN